jgi:hypothetical protein
MKIFTEPSVNTRANEMGLFHPMNRPTISKRKTWRLCYYFAASCVTGTSFPAW